MAKDFFGWARWSPHLGNAITIAVGVPTVIGVVAGWWAYLAPTNGLLIALIVLAAFLMALWACIGIVWLRDRALRQSPSQERKLLDCAWGLRVDAVLLSRDVSESSGAEWQVVVQIRNTLPWPLKAHVLMQNVIIENIVSDQKMDVNIPFIIPSNLPMNVNFPPYKKGALPGKERFKGRIDFDICYGHPDGAYSRVMTRRMGFEQVVSPPMPDGLPGILVPLGGTISLNYGAYEEDQDKPYSLQVR